MSIEFQLFGGVEAVRDGESLVLGSAKPRTVLAVLLLDANRPVALDELITRVWGTDAPLQASSSLHSYFTRLRSALDSEADIVRRAHGYALYIDVQAVDVHRFRALADRARKTKRADEAVGMLDQALDLWRGEPFAGLRSDWLDDLRSALAAERESILLDRVDLGLDLGQHDELITNLAIRVEQQPLNERLASQFMLALYRSGQHGEALIRFQKIKEALAEELGVDPGPALRDLHLAILQDDPRLTVSTSGGHTSPTVRGCGVTATRTIAPPVPRQLPMSPRSFTGRQTDLNTLSAALAAKDTESSGVSIIVGSGGVGKTWLALKWAHEHGDLFPDGQLFVDLRGFDPSTERMSPYSAMRTFLTALGVGPQVIPHDPDAITGLYRSILADRRLLLVIDNARDAEQVAPLLPSNPQCSTVITSRNRLTSLVATHNASVITLGVMPASDAHALLVSGLGTERAQAEPAAVKQLVTACGGLPLALSITVGLAHEHPYFPLASLATELQDAESVLTALEVDSALSVRSVLSTSYAALSPDQAEVFALLGLVPGPDISVDAVAALTGRSRTTTRTVLQALERGSLVLQHRPEQFRMHDLVRIYAYEQAEQRIAEAARTEAQFRLASFYVHTLINGARLVRPERPAIALPPPPNGCMPHTPSDRNEALQWFDLEVQNVLPLCDLAQRFGWHDLVWRLAWGSANFYERLGLHHEERVIWQAGLAAAEAVGDPDWQCLAHRFNAFANARIGNQEEALRHAQTSVALADGTANRLEQVFAMSVLAEAYARMHNTDEAVVASAAAWDLVQDQAIPIRLRVANEFAWFLAQNGQADKARAMADTILELHDQAGCEAQPWWRAEVLDTLSYICQRTGALEQAVDYQKEALTLFEPRTYNMADGLYRLGEIYRESGQLDEAVVHIKQALELYDEQHRWPEASHARSVLKDLT